MQLKNFDDLKYVLESMNFLPTVIGITETWLKENFCDPCTELPNYAFFSKSRSKFKGGGVGLFICKNLTHWLRDDISMFEEGCFESVFVEIKLGKFNIIGGYVYRPPFNNRDLNNNFFDILSLVLGKLKCEKKLVFLEGDFNRNLLDLDLQTDLFVDEMFSNGLFPFIDKPTYISTTATLDNIWTNNYMHPCKSAIFTDPISDHFAVFQCTHLSASTLRISNTENIRLFNDDDIHRFQEMPDNVTWHENDLDFAFTMFLGKLQIKYNEAFSIITCIKPKSRICSWFDAELCSLQKEKQTAYVPSQRNNRNWHITEFKTTTKESFQQRNLNISKNVLLLVKTA